jgi:pyroglutamyl-peptidase
MARPRVLLTGFGPFPGVPENPSAWLAETIAPRARDLDCELHAQVLPTEWEAVAALAPRLYESLQPHVMIHFGVSERAKGFRIERSAHNRTMRHADARGALPSSQTIVPQKPGRLDTSLPARTLAAHLKAQGLAATPSASAGRYLCNFLYYLSLDWAAGRDAVALFVHVPRVSAQGPLSEEKLLHGAQELLRLALIFAATSTARADPGGALNQAGAVHKEAG